MVQPQVLDLSKRWEPLEYEKAVLEAILFYQAQETGGLVLTIDTYVGFEIANAAIEVSGGKETIPWDESNLHSLETHIRRNLVQGKLCSQLEGAIVGMFTESSFSVGSRSRFGAYFSGEIIPGVKYEWTRQLPASVSISVQQTCHRLSLVERQQVEEIGKAMKKYFQQDLDTIRKNYWF